MIIQVYVNRKEMDDYPSSDITTQSLDGHWRITKGICLSLTDVNVVVNSSNDIASFLVVLPRRYF